MLLTKFVRIAREGKTVDDREIPREHIQQMADNYDPELYGARINKEHFRAWIWDGEFPTLGDVIALRAEEDDKGKLCLLAQLAPNSELVKLNEKGQKVYTSIEYDIDSVDDCDGAYLMGLAVTDSPASTGTQRLKFCIDHKDEMPGASKSLAHSFSAYIECELKLDEKESGKKLGKKLLSKITKLFDRQRAESDKEYGDLSQAIEIVATELCETQSTLNDHVTANQGGVSSEDFESLKTSFEKLSKDYDELKAVLETTPSSSHSKRPSAGNDTALAEC